MNLRNQMEERVWLVAKIARHAITEVGMTRCIAPAEAK